MRTVALALVLLCCASGLRAENVSLQGRWNITAPTNDTYSGDLVVDPDGRVVATGTTATRSGTWIGYVERSEASRIVIVLTDHKTVLRIRCVRPSRDLLNCDNASADERQVSGMYYMRRAAER